MRQYRHDGKQYETKSLILRQEIIEQIQGRMNDYPGYTLSRFIEETVSEFLKNNTVDKNSIQVKRNTKDNANSIFIKKTCTFSHEFVKKISSGHNMSGLVDYILTKAFKK